jgi:hypothetical protein
MESVGKRSGPGCAQALITGHLQDVIRSHLGAGVAGFVVPAAWWPAGRAERAANAC